MKPIALNGLVLYVTDATASADLYTKLGFELLSSGAKFANVKLGDILINFQDKTNPTDPDFVAEAMGEPKGVGLFIYIQVDDIDAYFEEIKKRGVEPTTTPRDWPSGNREFVVRDHDGYKLVFYESHGSHTLSHRSGEN